MTSPQPISDLFWAHWKTKTMLSAIALGVFTELAKEPLSAAEAAGRLRIAPAAAADFLDALVALGLLDRADGRYTDAPESAEYLDANKPATYLGDSYLAQCSGLADDLTGVLRTGEALRGARDGQHFYQAVYGSSESTRAFQRDMTALSMGSALAIAERFPWQQYRTLADIGCAEGALAGRVLRQHHHLTAIGFDLPQARPGFESYTRSLGLAGRAAFQPGDFFRDPLPSADVLVFGHVLHNWSHEEKRLLLRKARQALPQGGALLIYETLIDDDRRRNAVGLILSLMMHAEVPGGYDYTGAECRGWLAEAGFREVRVEALDGPEAMIVAIR
ncbi:methyltransferase [Sorangium sp. So ce1151]|uniref:methyltransferase n=1 Tax=Sorangium sp. So ce1151 TaxID=3133332 RepID=UPI003F646188